MNASTEIGRPIAYGVLKIKGKLGELMPAEQGKRNDKLPKAALGSCEFTAHTISAYRKIGAHKKQLKEYYEACEEIPESPTRTGRDGRTINTTNMVVRDSYRGATGKGRAWRG